MRTFFFFLVSYVFDEISKTKERQALNLALVESLNISRFVSVLKANKNPVFGRWMILFT